MLLESIGYALMYIFTIAYIGLVWFLKVFVVLFFIALLLFCVLYLIIMFAPVKYILHGESKGSLETTQIKGRLTMYFKLISVGFEFNDGVFITDGRIFLKNIFRKKNKNEKFTDKNVEKDLDIDILNLEDFEDENTQTSKKIKQKEIPLSKKDKLSFFDKMNLKIGQIKWNFKQFYVILKKAILVKDKLIWFFERERTKKTMEDIKLQGFKLLKIYKPKNLNIDAKFGFEDPSLTGKCLGAYCIVAPYFGKYNINIEPQFEEKVCDLKIHMVGKIKLHYLLMALVKVFIKKENRLTIETFRRLKL